MTTPTRPGTARRATPPSKNGVASSSPRLPLVAVAVAVIAVLAVLVVVFTGGDDDENVGASSPAVDGDAATPGASAAFAPITVDGAALADFASDDDPAVGERAPVLTGTDPDGAAVTTAVEGAPTVIAVVAHWCPHCAAEVPRIVELVDTGAIAADTRIVALATGSNADAPNFPPGAWLADNDWTGDVLLDDEASTGATALGTTGYPLLVILDGDGRVVERLAGEQPAGAIADAIARAA